MKKLAYILIVLFTLNSFSQGEASKWYFGQGAAVDFSSGTPTNIGGSLLNTNEGCSSFSDSSGNLLFYIGAPNLGDVNLTIWDRNNNPMPNGVGLQGDASSAQSALTVPIPGQPDRYYIFTVGASSSGNSGFFYYTLDMSSNGGLGDIVGGVTPLHQTFATDWTEKVTAVKGDECNTFWVVSQVNRPAFNDSQFWAYKVDDSPGGVDLTSLQISTVADPATDVRGYLKVSPNGEKLATAHYDFNFSAGSSFLWLYSFDNSTGIVSNDGIALIDTTKTPGDGSPYGVEFNSNSDKLYTSTHDGTRNNVFQFDLTATDVESTKALISSEIGFRGALQLAQDGKIYATRPTSYSIGRPWLDVIENPNADAVDVTYNLDAVNLGTGLAMQGLPPFISSIYDGIELTGTDSSGNTIVLNDTTINLCVGENLDIAPENVTGIGTVTYNWYFNTDVTPFASTSDISFTSVTPTINGDYTLVVNFTDDCGEVTTLEGTFEIAVYDQPTATQPTNMVVCDNDNNGTMPFTLTDQDATINTDAGMSITYYLSQVEADAGTTGALASPYESGSTTIYARVENDNNTPCYDTTTFDLEVYESAFPSTTVLLLAECDNTSIGTDADGLIEFNLHDRATEILNGQAAADFTLTYFIDAAYTVQIPVVDETAFTNTIAGGQPIYVRMTNNANTTCFTDTSFNIEIYPLPVLVPITAPLTTYELVQCDDPSNDAEANFNLNQANGDVIDPITTETFTYYTTQALAEAGVAGTEIPDATAFNVTGSTDDVWVRVETVNGCYRTAMVHLVIRPSAINPDYQLYNCDDNLDVDGNDTVANDDTDGISSFDFQNEVNLILTPFSSTSGVSLSVHHTETDADAGLNPIDPTTYSNYRNITSPNQEQLWVRVVSSLGNDCLANGNFITLNVNPIPTLNTVANLEECDNDNDGDDTNGIGVEFDLESQSDLIRQAGMAAVDFPVTYHLSVADATSGNAPQSSPYTNLSNGETIYVRTVNAATGCVNPHLTFNLDVNPLPIIDFTNITLASQCDDDSDGDDTNGIGVEFDLGSIRNDFENLQPDIATVNYTVTYHALLTDAQANPALNALSDLHQNTTNNQSIFVRIENDDTGCIRIEEAANYLVVDPLPILTPISVTPRCDDGDDGDDTNEVVTWNLNDYITNFNAMQTTVDPVSVTFHTTLLGANSVTPSDQITDSNTYENISNPQEIFVRITNDVTGCYRGIHAFDLEVDFKPEFDVIDQDIVCTNILPHEISVTNPDASDYMYEWFNSQNTSIGTDQTLILDELNITDLTIAGVDYTVTVTNPTTGCFRIKTINLKKSSIATLLDADIVTIEFDSPANSIEVNTSNLGFGDYEFALQHDADSRSWQDEPVFTDLQGGVYTILINDKNDCGEISKVLFLLDYPKFLTPNNDGYNDYWQLIGLDSTTYTISPIQLFDRFGKIVAIINPTKGQGWDGLYNNKSLPSSDYWFVLSLTNSQGETIIKKGHFSLIRR